MDVEDGAGWRVVSANCSRDGMGIDGMRIGWEHPGRAVPGSGAARAPAAGRIGCGRARLEAFATGRLGWLRYVRRAAG